MISNGRDDWNNITSALAVLAFVPLAACAMFSGFKRHSAPVISGAIVVTALFCVAISILAGLRISLSFQALLLCYPVLLFALIYANLRLHRAVNARVALLSSARLAMIQAYLDKLRILPNPEASLEDVEIILIDPDEHHTSVWSSFLARCYLGGVEVMPWTRYLEIRQGRIEVSSFEITHLNYTPSQILYARCKRALDVCAVLLSLPLTLPLAGLVAAYLYALDKGPVLFVQVRRGYGGQRFRMYKFRTMYKGTGGGSTIAGDARIMPGCNMLRKLRLDELPQLFNILRGDMSLIGPRPVAEYVAKASERVEPKYALRSLVLPGITGWAQVTSGYASTTEEEIEKLSYDLYYIKNLSFDLDLIVLFKTIRTVVFGTGAR
ncbi:sugar transferase [Shinella sp. H4-D48]|uniref:sugar transferase n=1 Tax=Shinella sp. H4-D48 TaxID=2925841 RepID=UPI001F52E9E3|nr:sugar transferase [Shinella sp. H4-D48]UNK38243.1 sugar transferase [Shinella sp. H4-D48]